jgi:O-succinylbenzoate synthase
MNSLSVTSSALKRPGALLQVAFDSGMSGYADCHAWPELGDLPVQQQLINLAQGKYTPLTRCAMEFATLDAQNRSCGKSVFDHASIPSSHFLVTDMFDWTSQHVQQIIQQGYTHVKLKVGRNLEREIEGLHALFSNTSLKLRLDFNEALTLYPFLDFLEKIQKLKEQIDFIEDPIPFQPEEWAAIQNKGWTLACDRQVNEANNKPEAAAILIIKPALQPFEEWQKCFHQKRIVTSYLGHPLGQVAAAYVAAQVDPDCSCVHGLLSHHAYQPTSFSQHLNWKNPSFVLPPGIGFGFDHELEQLNWKPLEASLL